MRKLLIILVLIASDALAQMYGTNYVAVMFDRSDNKFYPQGATDFVTNNTSIRDLQSAAAQETEAREFADATEAVARSSADLSLSNRLDNVSDRVGSLEEAVTPIGGTVDHSRATFIKTPSYTVDNSNPNLPALAATGEWDFTRAFINFGSNLPDLSDYASMEWVKSYHASNAPDLTGLATEFWVSDQLAGYAQKASFESVSNRVSFIEQDYITSSELGATSNAFRTKTIDVRFDPGESVSVTGFVSAVHSDVMSDVELVATLDTNFPASRIMMESWRGDTTSITTDPENGLRGVFDAMPGPHVTNGCCFVTEGGDTCWITSWDPDTLTAVFTPALQPDTIYAIVDIRPAALDASLHYGSPVHGSMNVETIIGWPNNAPGSVATKDGRIVYYAPYGANILYKSVDGARSIYTIHTPNITGNYPALATHDGRTLFLIRAGSRSIFMSEDGGETWTAVAQCPANLTLGEDLKTPDGLTLFFTSNNGLWKSVDRGQHWTQLNVPSGIYPHVATADGITVYYSCPSGVFRSTDGGNSWENLVNFPALSAHGTALDTPDGVTVYASSYSLNGVFVSYDAGETWTEIPGFARLDYTSLAAAKGGTVFIAGNKDGGQKGTPAYASVSTNAWTAVIGVSDADMSSISDFALTMTGDYYVYCAFETAHDEFGIFSPAEYPQGWHTIARKTNDIWHVRTTNGMAATSCTSAPEAITAAILTNGLNRTQYMSYSPIYGFSGFGGGLPVRMSATYLPYSSINTPSVEEIRVLASAYSETKKWNTGAFDIRVISDDPPTTSVQWNGAEPTDATIYYSEQ